MPLAPGRHPQRLQQRRMRPRVRRARCSARFVACSARGHATPPDSVPLVSGLSRLGPGTLVTGLVAAAVLWVAYDNGSYGLASRSTLAIVVWWGLIVGLVFGLLQREPIPRASLVVGALVAALALWTLASLFWTADAEATFDEFNRVTLYLGTFTLVALGSRRSTLGRWADGLAVAIAAVAAIAITSRLFPGSFPEGDLPTFLPGAVTRLSFPLGYWNGLAIFVALGVPLLLRLALVARSPLLRGLALAPMPVIAATVYLTSSRGGVVTVIVGSMVFIALTERRWAATAALGASALGAAAAVALLLDRDELVNGPLGTDLVERQGRSAALLIGLSCVGDELALRARRELVRGSSATAGVGRTGRCPRRPPPDGDRGRRLRSDRALPALQGIARPGSGIRGRGLRAGAPAERKREWTLAVLVRGARPVERQLARRRRGRLVRELVVAARVVLVLRAGHAFPVPGGSRGARNPRSRALTLALAVSGVAAGVALARAPASARVTAAALACCLRGVRDSGGVRLGLGADRGHRGGLRRARS